MKLTKRPVAMAAGTLLAVAALGTGVAAASTHATSSVPNVSASSGPTADSGPNVEVQSGSQTAPDTASSTTETSTEASAETSTEAASTEAASTEADGPGGYADANGANVDTQQTGNH